MNFEVELKVGKPNSLGNTLKVVKFVEKNPKNFTQLTKLLLHKDSIISMRAMNAVKRLIRADAELFDANKKDFLNKFSKSKASVVRLGLIIIYFDFLKHFTESELKKIKTLSLAWTKEASDWMVLAQGLKLLEKLAIKDQALQKDLLKLARSLSKDDRKAVAGKAKKIVERFSTS